MDWFIQKFPFVYEESEFEDLEHLKERLARAGWKREYLMFFRWDPAMLNAICMSGCFPMATYISYDRNEEKEGYPVGIAKLDLERCCLRLADFKWRKSTKLQATPYRLTVNQAWDQTIAGIWKRHGVNWVFPPLADGFKAMRPSDDGQAPFPARVYSVELWHGDQLAAAEIGYVCGATYTSLSGYFVSSFKGAGRVQLSALGCLLKQCGFDLWDFGMFMQYKVSYGASNFSRDHFFSLFQQNLSVPTTPLELFLTPDRKSVV